MKDAKANSDRRSTLKASNEVNPLEGAVLLPYGYMVDALGRLSCMYRELKRAVVIELVLLAAEGMAINDLETNHRLKTIDGELDALYLTCLFYAAVQEVTPVQVIGIDFSGEC